MKLSRVVRTVSRALLLWLMTTHPAFPQVPPDQNTITGEGSPVDIDYDTAHLDKVVTAVRISDSIAVDGYLDEAAWDLAVPARDFIQWQPNPGALSVEQTEARFIYDDENLYVGVVSFDSNPDQIVVTELIEDFNFRGSDGVSLILDSLHDLRSGFNFVTNPAGAKADYQISDGRFNQNWDGVWDVKTSINDEGWIAEFMIPFKTLRFSNSPSQEWGVNMSRRTLRLNEESYWSPIPVRYNISRLSLAGTVRGLENVRQGRNLKVTPFVTSGFTQTRASNDGSGELLTDQDYDGGMDLKYSLTPSLTLDATYRTDFAQVEVDQQQVNLTRFNLFFPEQRAFFLENAGTFSFGEGAGFGGGGNLVPFFSRRIGLGDDGTPIPIIGGARVTGQLDRYNIGFLTMKTERKESTPSNDYLVGRVKRNLLTDSWVGALVINRDSTLDGDYNRVYGADAHFRFDRLEFDSYLLRSDTPGISDKNQARQLAAAWRDDELVVAGGYNAIQTNFNPEVGFVRRPNVTEYTGEFSWNPLIQSSQSIRNLIFGTNLTYSENGTTEKVETRTQSVTLGVLFQNNGRFSFGVEETFDRLLDEFRIRPDIPIAAGDHKYRRYSVSARTDASDKISGQGSFDWGDFWDGDRKSVSGTLSLKPNFHLNLDLNYSHNRVNLPNGRFTTDLVGARFLYAFTPRVFFNAFIQYNAARNQLSSNIRFHFIHHPLSDLYLVYNDLRDTNTGQLTQRALIVKLTNLFDF